MGSNVEDQVIAKVKALAPGQQEEVLRFVETLEHRGVRAGRESYGAEAKTILEEIEQLSNLAPPEEWDKVPSDLSENIDHYLYGAPKK